MPITPMKTSSRSKAAIKAAADIADSFAPEVKEKLYLLVETYLQIVEDPVDTQIHALAASLGLDHEVFEQFLYEILSNVVKEGQKLTASEPDGALAEQDGEPDLEQAFGETDQMKEAGENDGGIDTEQLDENLKELQP